MTKVLAAGREPARESESETTWMTEAKLVDFEQQGVANMLRLPFQDHKESADEKRQT